MMELAIKPELRVEELREDYGKFVVEPLERGYGTTLGNSLRRVLLSSIPGAGVTRVRFDGHYHEYDTITGVKEDILEIILNLKELALRVPETAPEVVRLELEAEGPGEVTAGQITTHEGVEILNPELHIATLDEGGRLKVEMEVERGVGYRPAERNKRPDMPLGIIPIDTDFSPVKKVNFTVEPARVGERTDLDRLILEVETNRGIKPDEAVTTAARILIEHLRLFEELGAPPPPLEEEEPEELNYPLLKLDFDRRACNLLESKGVITLRDLLQKTREELLDIHGFGEKTLDKVEERLAELGYSLQSERERRKGKEQGE